MVLAGEIRATSRPVAVKIPHGQILPSEEARVLREARHVSGLRHPHLVQLIGVFRTEDSRLALVYERIEGGGLDPRALAQAGPEQRWAWIREISEGVGVLSEAGLAHRDIKPENVLIRRDGSLVLADFGLLRSIGDQTLTREGVILGTPAFMAPEALLGQGDPVAGDTYALACLITWILSQELPYPEQGPGESYRAKTQRPPRPALGESPNHPVNRVLARALAAKPDQRYESLREFLDDLWKAQEGGGTSAMREERTQVLGTRAPPSEEIGPGRTVPTQSQFALSKEAPRTYGKWPGAFLLGLLVLGAGWLGGFWSRGGPSSASIEGRARFEDQLQHAVRESQRPFEWDGVTDWARFWEESEQLRAWKDEGLKLASRSPFEKDEIARLDAELALKFGFPPFRDLLEPPDPELVLRTPQELFVGRYSRDRTPKSLRPLRTVRGAAAQFVRSMMSCIEDWRALRDRLRSEEGQREVLGQRYGVADGLFRFVNVHQSALEGSVATKRWIDAFVAPESRQLQADALRGIQQEYRRGVLALSRALLEENSKPASLVSIYRDFHPYFQDILLSSLHSVPFVDFFGRPPVSFLDRVVRARFRRVRWSVTRFLGPIRRFAGDPPEELEELRVSREASLADFRKLGQECLEGVPVSQGGDLCPEALNTLLRDLGQSRLDGLEIPDLETWIQDIFQASRTFPRHSRIRFSLRLARFTQMQKEALGLTQDQWRVFLEEFAGYEFGRNAALDSERNEALEALAKIPGIPAFP